MTMGKKIAALRAAKGWTQEELADGAGVTVRTVQRIESGDTQPRAYTLKALAKALGEEVGMLAGLPPAEAPISTAGPIDAAPDLYILNLSSFAYLVIPFVHALVPYRIWKKHQATLSQPGRRIVLQQFHWTIALYGLLLLTVAYNLLLVRYAGQGARAYLASYGWVVAFMYVLNGVLILRTALLIRRGTLQNVG